MTQQISNLAYLPVTADGLKSAAVVVCDVAIDSTWAINLLGTVQGTARNVAPKFITIDNIDNSKSVTVTLGNFTFTTPPFLRENYTVPDGVTTCNIIVQTGAVNVTISEVQLAPDATNQLLVQTTAVKTLIYQYRYYTGGTIYQSVDDQNSQVVFAGPISADYILLPIFGGAIGNGWFQYVRNTGTGTVQIYPIGVDTLNDVFNNISPIVLQPGDSGILSSDGVQWYYVGTSGFRWYISLTGTGVISTPHGLKVNPFGYKIVLNCFDADAGYPAGTTLQINGSTTYIDPFTGTTYVVPGLSDDTNLYYIYLPGGFSVLNLSTLLFQAIDPAKWFITIVATVTWPPREN